jgi:hypothetical protein
MATPSNTDNESLISDQDATLHEIPLDAATRSTATGVYGAVPTNISDRSAAKSFFARLSTRQKLLAVLGPISAIAVTIGVAVALTRKPVSQVDDGCSYSGYRLGPYVSPLGYNVYWKPYFASSFSFDGRTDADLLVTSDGLNCVQLHASGLDISAVSVAYGANTQAQSLQASAWRYDIPNERVVVTLPSTANAGTVLHMHFVYNVQVPNGTLSGLYMSSYKDDNNATVYLAATQFEATAARYAIVCLDEPQYKAVFNVTLDGIPNTYTALSNMPVLSTVANGAYSTVSFYPSPKMSTYLVAAVIAPMISVTRTIQGKDAPIVTSVYAVNKAANIPMLQYALDQGCKILPFYEQKFGIGYPLPKMDMVAVSRLPIDRATRCIAHGCQ